MADEEVRDRLTEVLESTDNDDLQYHLRAALQHLEG